MHLNNLTIFLCVYEICLSHFIEPEVYLHCSKGHLLELNLVFNHLLGHIHVHNELYKKSYIKLQYSFYMNICDEKVHLKTKSILYLKIVK